MNIRNHTFNDVDKHINTIRQLSFSKRISWVKRMAESGRISFRCEQRYNKSFIKRDGTVDLEAVEKYISFYELLFNSLEHIYPGKWDVHVERFRPQHIDDRNCDYNFNSSKIQYELMPFVHYDKIDITNSDDSEHVIKDLFVGIRTQYDTRQKTMGIYTVTGFRSTMSFGEWNVGYLHSHLSDLDNKPSADRVMTIRDFCTGSGDISELIPQMNDISEDGIGFSEENWGMFFSVVETMIKWESLEGGPYHFIDKITEATSNLKVNKILYRNDLESYCKKVYSKYMENIYSDIPKFTFSYNSGSYHINFKNEHIESIKKFLVDNFLDFSHKLVIREQDNNYIGYQPGNSPSSSLNFSILIQGEIPYFFLAGRKIEYKITPPVQSVDNNNLSNFHIREEFLNLLKNEFNKTAYQQQVIQTARENACATV